MAAGALWLAGCGGPQSALDPAGRGAERIASLFWWMAGGAAILWLALVGLAFYIYRARPKWSIKGEATVLIIGGGAVVPTLVLAVLLSYGLALLPDLVAPAGEGSLRSPSPENSGGGGSAICRREAARSSWPTRSACPWVSACKSFSIAPT